ncbi:hypothetical protein LCGC14_1170500, partial [marine sediment metagenome]
MIAKDIENVELEFLDLKDYQELKTAMKEVYKNIPDNYWEEKQIKSLIKLFPEGQAVIKVNGQLAGCSLSIIVDYDRFEDNHTYQEITGQETFSTHTADGDVLYGIDVFIRFNKKYKKEISELTGKILEGFNKKRIHGSRDYFRIKINSSFFVEIIPVKKIKNSRESENITDLSYSHVI